MEKIILITGGGRGIGAACALLAARQGYAVCINYIADVSDEAAVERLFGAVNKRFGRLSALINNAGVLSAQMRVDQMDAARINWILTTNVVC